MAATATAIKTKTKPPADDAPKTTELMDPKTGELVAVDGDLSGYAEDAGAGFENQTSEDVGIPFMVVLQPGSPEVQTEDSPAKPGMIINKTTGDLISGREGFVFIPASTQHVFVEWVPRDKGGGLVGQHAIDSELVLKVRGSQPLGDYKHPENGNDLVETFYTAGLVDVDSGPYPAIIAWGSSHIRSYKDFMFRARSLMVDIGGGRRINPPLFSHRYRITTERQERNGNTWYIPRVTFANGTAPESRLVPSDPLYQAAKAVHAGVQAGGMRGDTSSLKRDTGDAALRKGDTSAEKAPY